MLSYLEMFVGSELGSNFKKCKSYQLTISRRALAREKSIDQRYCNCLCPPVCLFCNHLLNPRGLEKGSIIAIESIGICDGVPMTACFKFRLDSRPPKKKIIAVTYGPQHEKTCLRGFANNTSADQPAHSLSLISTFVIRFLESNICKLATGEISIF